jgi:hypothetical protein
MYHLCTLNGFDNIQDGGGAFLNSASNPLKEALHKLEGIRPGAGDALVIFGAGAGYLMESASRDFGVKCFIVFEPDQEITLLSLQREELAGLIDDPYCTAYFFDVNNFNEGLLEDILLQHIRKKFVTVESHYFKRAAPEFFGRVRGVFVKKYAACLEINRKYGEAGFFHKTPGPVYSSIAARAVFEGTRKEDMP